MNTSPQTKSNHQPSNAPGVEAWCNHPNDGSPARYKITGNDGAMHQITLPAPVMLGVRTVSWRRSGVENWLATQQSNVA